MKHKLYFFVKRLFDLFCSLIGLVCLLVLIVIIKIIYVCTGDFSKIIFVHQRIGKQHKPFKMYKFRTMVPNADEVLKEILKDPARAKEWQLYHKLNNDPRITKVGNILRKTSIDEFPQFINIFLGDMSLIGPRPLVSDEIAQYGKEASKLLSVRPGLTGYWACNGRSNCSPKQRRELELYYVDHCSLGLDIKIFFMTIVKVIKKEGAK